MSLGIIGGEIGYRLLRRVSPGGAGACDESAYGRGGKLEALLGPEIWDEVCGRVVIDFGCGAGAEAVEVAAHGAKKVIGLDVRVRALEKGREAAARAGVAGRCEFLTETDERADLILCIDAFEHFADPAAILKSMRGLLKEGGSVVAAFGPTWYHPLGGHLFSVFPWAHLVFTERALMRWRADFKSDGATRFGEVEGGLNRMTVRRFERLARACGFRFAEFEAVPIRRLAFLSNRLTREFVTALVRCRLVPE